MKFSFIKKIFKQYHLLTIGTATFFVLATPFLVFTKYNIQAKQHTNDASMNSNTRTASNQNIGFTYLPSEVTLSGIDEFFIDNASIPNKETNKNFFTYNNIYAAQHFGDQWLEVDYINGEYQYKLGNDSDLTKVHQGLKYLIKSSIQNLPETDEYGNPYDYLSDDTYMKIVNFYVDNYNGEIIVNVEIGAYYDNSGTLVDSISHPTRKKLTFTTKFDGFKTAEKTQFSNTVLIHKLNDVEITNDNITDFVNSQDALTNEFVNTINNRIDFDSSIWGTNQENFETNATPISNPNELGNEVTVYPGLKQLRTNIGVNNFFGDLYIDTNTFRIYADNPQHNRTKIGTFISHESNKSSTLRNFVANYDNSNAPTTYVKEGTYSAAPSIRNYNPSNVTIELIKNNMFKNIDDILANPVKRNIDGTLTSLSSLEFITTNEDLQNPNSGLINNITGEVTLKVKVGFNNVNSEPGEYKYQGREVKSTDEIQPGRERIFTIVINNFLPIQATSITNSIDASKYNFAYKPSQMIKDNTNSRNLLIKLLKDATNDGLGFSSIPGNIDTFFNSCIEFMVYDRPQGGGFLGVPNDKNGTLYLTIELKKYYNEINGLLVDATADNSLPSMYLTTTIQNMQTQDLNEVPVLKTNLSEPTYIDWYPETIPTQLLGDIEKDLTENKYSGEFTIERIQDAIFDYAIVGLKDNNLKNNITFTTVSDSSNSDVPDAYKYSDQYMSVNSELTSNISGNLNLYFHIHGVYDEDDAIEITTTSQESFLFTGFKQIKPTNMYDNVYLVNQEIYATDITDAVDPKTELAKSILTIDGAGKLINLKNLFTDDKGIPQEIKDNLLNQNFTSVDEALTIFNKYFEIDEILNTNDSYYYQNGEITAIISLKLYYDEDGNLINTMNSNNNEDSFTKRIVLSGYIESNPSSIVPITNLSSVRNNYASDYDNPEKIEDLILRNFDKISENFPKTFFDNINKTGELWENSYMSVQNPIINNLNGRINVDIKINCAYFTSENIYVNTNTTKETIFPIIIEGFALAEATVIKPVIKLSDLNIIDDEPYNTDLTYWSEINLDGNPSNNLNMDFFKRVISNNIVNLVENPYDAEKALTDSNYFKIENPLIKYGEGIISFDLVLNYYFRGADAYPVSPQKPNNIESSNNRATINIIGFDACYETVSTDEFDVSDTELKNYTATFIKNLWDSEPHKASQMIMNTILSSEKNLNNLFENLPSWYFKKNSEGKLDYASNRLSITNIEFDSNSTDMLNITIYVDYVFAKVSEMVTIKEAGDEFVIRFSGFKSGSLETSINSHTWDIDRSIVSDIQIAYWNNYDVALSKLQQLLNNNSGIYENYFDNLVFDSTGKVTSKVYVNPDVPINVIAKEGIIEFSGYVKPYYDENGNEMNDSACVFENAQIRNFNTQNPTTANQNTIYTSNLTNNVSLMSNEDPLFGKDTVTNFLNANDGKGNELLKNALVNRGGRQILQIMLSNTEANPNLAGGINLSNTVIEDVKIGAPNDSIYAGNDFEGSLTFKITIKNYFDANGVWNTQDPYTINEYFTIYQSNLTQKTNLSNTEASVEELSKIYNDLGGGSLNFDPNIRASDFYNNITNEKNFGFFELFMESLVDKGVYGISAKNTPTGFLSNPKTFKPLKMQIYNDNELVATNDNYKNFINFNDEQGWVSIKVKYSNVYEEDETVFANVSSDSSPPFLTLKNDAQEKEVTLKIVGFNKDTQTNDFIIIVATVASSIGFILIIGLLILFIIKKAREHH